MYTDVDGKLNGVQEKWNSDAEGLVRLMPLEIGRLGCFAGGLGLEAFIPFRLEVIATVPVCRRCVLDNEQKGPKATEVTGEKCLEVLSHCEEMCAWKFLVRFMNMLCSTYLHRSPTW